MIMKKQTAVEWLIENHFGNLENCTPNFRNKINEAKAMEKEQIIDAYKQCENSHISWECDGSQDYYTSTYGQ
jgi:hypothetical protein